MRLLPLVVLLSGCLLSNGSSPDAGGYQTIDGAPYPGFRDAGCSGGGASGTSGGASGVGCGGNSGTGSLADAAVPDAELPDAAPPCDLVTFHYTNATASSVWVTGDFTSWAATVSAGALQMTKSGGDQWTRSAQIGPGHHVYKFIIDGTTWIADPDNPMTEDDGFGGVNSVIDTCGGVN